uniref:Uncharacterized protein n=1 Tax=Cacopsylla melanoneura TaxID=428564 RepID=A0A8D8LMD2_9HEMI
MTKTKPDTIIQTQFFSLEITFSDVAFNDNFENPHENGVLSVRAKFIKYPTIEITEDNFCDSCGGDEVFNNGKHFLISLEDKDIQRLLKEFIINVKVMMTSQTPDLLPVVEQVGFTSVNIARTFANLFCYKAESKPSKECPRVKLLSDQLEIIDPASGTIVGTINIHLRLKAFGKYMITDMKDFSDMFDKCVETKVIVDDDDKEEENAQEKLTLENNDNEYQELHVECEDAEDVGLRVKVTKPVYDVPPAQKKEKRATRPGTIYMGKDQIVFLAPKENEHEDKIIYDMKSGMVPPPDDQIINVIPDSFMRNPDKESDPTSEVEPPTPAPTSEGEDVYGFYIKKVNMKKNLYSMVEWDCKVPKSIPKERNRHTRYVQYHPMDLVKK